MAETGGLVINADADSSRYSKGFDMFHDAVADLDPIAMKMEWIEICDAAEAEMIGLALFCSGSIPGIAPPLLHDAELARETTSMRRATASEPSPPEKAAARRPATRSPRTTKEPATPDPP